MAKAKRWVRLCAVKDLHGAGPFATSANGVDVALLRIDGEWRAYEGRCPHQGASLGEGDLDGGVLICRNHGWRFSAADGRRISAPGCLKRYRVEERERVVYIDAADLERPQTQRPAKRSAENLPGPRPLPIIGNLLQIKPAAAHLDLERWAERYGSFYKIRVGRALTVVTSDPAAIDQVLRARPNVFRRESNQDRILSELGVKGVFNAEGDVWRPQRRLAVAALAQRHLRDLYPQIRRVAKRLSRRWRAFAERGEAFDVVEELQRYTVDIAMLTAFGHDANTVEKDSDLIQRHLEIIFPSITRRLFAPLPIWRFVRTGRDGKLERALEAVRQWLQGLLVSTRARLAHAASAGDPTNFLEAMLTAVDDEGAQFSEDVVMSNLVTMLLAGEDTTAFTLAWAIHHLCDSPRWARELSREAETVLGDAEVAEDLETVGKLVKANAVANETMRLRPVAPIIASEALLDTVVGDLAIPRGAVIAALVRPAALRDVHFASPREFRPERWLGGGPGPHNFGISIPFGAGPRMCPGRALATAEMNALLSMLFRTFEVERVGDSSDVAERFGFTMRPVPLKARLRLRA